MPSDNGSTPTPEIATTSPGADTPAGSPTSGPATPASTGNSQIIGTAVKDVKAAFDGVKSLLLPALTPLERKRLPKVRKAAETLIDELVALAVSRPQLVPLGTDPKQLEDELTRVGQLNTLVAEVNVLHTGVGDTVTRLQADLNKAALDIYAIASRSGVADPGVAAVVAKMAKILARGPRQKHVVVKVPVKTVTVPADTAVPPPTGDIQVPPATGKAGHKKSSTSSPVPASATNPPSGGSGGSTPASPTAGNSAGGGTGGTSTGGSGSQH